ncbi:MULTISPECIES: GbsR/MarR family transcriptional regulator [Streptosporangium]|uniref:DNA-binding transcriptional regulator GbsR (MarR family) n=1 Tax=Streptosporangium brasiliense TaxID=47480 RepID=A0ABT9RLQ0_9ACTN|nr:MarR family transcriptional regulator [Streptosporangium brasiliense]MDP9869275.1 DNA-binding transcriptional regulator GbsR (MarR family) [Streptosporangium brasiliense]
MNAERRAAFVTSVGDLLASWHLPHATGRVYGLLLITDRPDTLDAIAAELGLSKGAVSTAVRQLDSWGLARVIPQPGSRRLLVEAAGGLETLLEAGHARARKLIAALHDGETLVGPGPARDRLQDVIGLFEGYVDVGVELLRQRRR